ncbi:30S ribosomal protein S1 [Candidatus Uhrbacteria bacterium CG_4_9_14_0_2_um_filter_41_50]|uniref:30S ribosomal protein S1 n=1 Tax=Candidatus Uhrbacteria bacterium CG_4_9_14_0_2_um_filter_41_50 TaxID=1975031 RepID=A0A2M8EQ63_9BACT|nr:MAG: 30S ribosomal protein S1 [Candidatus Uhrbacteria bacterium CG_4_10_14_3_um_filter_41_21]PIZ54488.1 MAG: 30S ribosomal protein S1 [Candidatus Uhrbacteria bacterium CG_4_10_14_0_2_um_filter_41_21]PJB84838.1 MAG: 30S ribosomal protein S1 [Candidatus Uhrbacteria bacterium CG_4_9_14_0_8_um_filter_41_16]PJC24883.1 MAG: 30S ribosomal protein S1 [Candidatus Uhrbacteria bacterium CG_4_9_14_0_2_um_filter_41_50]PJE75223.1 MAG: 30S ribosomal protein S1 [Candidatus Uhrbacteria bacterium CG10_big_fil
MIDTTETSKLAKLLENNDHLQIPGLGDLIVGTVISTKGREVRIDVNGLTTGVVRGRELFTESGQYSKLQPGEKIEATVVDLENENGEMELSFRYAGDKKTWEDLKSHVVSGESVEAKVLDANKGGLIVKVKHLQGFLPVSQLAPEHYPRVSGGDKQKILDKLKEFVGKKIMVQVLDINETDEKLIVSEKAIWETEQKSVISQIKVGQIIEGEITALADFGAFVKFKPEGSDDGTELEGLVHISEIAWQRIDHPKDILTPRQTVKAEIIGIEGSKIFLSMKKLVEDPWHDVEKKYKVGDSVEGTVIKANPFGLFVELDADIHGLAHVSELSDNPAEDPTKIAKAGDIVKFKIVSIEPKEHRLGLSIKALNEVASEKKETPVAEEKPAKEVAAEETAETETKTE